MENLEQELQKHLEVIRNSVMSGRYTQNAVEESVFRLIEIREQNPQSIPQRDIEILERVILKYGLI